MENSLKYESCINDLSSLIRNIENLDDEDEISQILKIAREKVLICLKKFSEDSELNYLAGLVMYESITSENDFGDAAEKHFDKAVILNPNHQFAKMYLGYYYFDNERYLEALEIFEKIKEDYFLALNQKWRILKLHELILCCKCYLNDANVKERSFRNLIKEFENTDNEDVPLPLELAKMFFLTKNNSIWKRIDKSLIQVSIVKMLQKFSFFESLKQYFI